MFVYALPGGAPGPVVALAEAWSARGARVTIVTEAPTADDGWPVSPDIARRSLGTAGPAGSALGRVLGFAAKVYRLRRLLAHERPTAVVAFLVRGNNVAVLAAAGLGIRVFVSERNDPRFAPVAPVDRLLRPLTYRRARGVVVQTPAIAESVRTLFRAERLAVIPNAAPVRAAATVRPAGPGEEGMPGPAGRPYILAMGRLAPQKGFDTLIRAFARSRARHAFDLLIAGEGGERAALERLVARQDLDGRVHLPGFSDDPLALHRGCAFFVLSSRYEGFPNVLLEAMACGKAVVTTAFPAGADEIVTHGADGLVVPVDDPPALAAALDALAGDEALRHALGTAGRASVRRFDPDAVAALWDRLVLSS